MLSRLFRKSFPKKKLTIGWKEYVDLPDWKIRNLKAKVDTGARTSAIHVEAIERLERNKIRFLIPLVKKSSIRHVQVTARIKRKAHVRSSHGTRTRRYFVTTTMRLGPVTKKIELNLADRSKMTYPMILGRTTFKSDFLVDAHHTCILSRRLKTARKFGANPQ